MLKRFRAAPDEIYGDRLNRVVFTAHMRAATRTKLPITTLQSV